MVLVVVYLVNSYFSSSDDSVVSLSWAGVVSGCDGSAVVSSSSEDSVFSFGSVLLGAILLGSILLSAD